MLLQFRELGEFRGAEYGEYDRNPTSNRFGSIQSGRGGDKEAFLRFTTRRIGRLPGGYGGTVMEDLRGSTLRPSSDFIQATDRGDIYLWMLEDNTVSKLLDGHFDLDAEGIPALNEGMCDRRCLCKSHHNQRIESQLSPTTYHNRPRDHSADR